MDELKGFKESIKPPLGLAPKHITDTQRAIDIANAIIRYLEYGKAIPLEWLKEYNQLVGGVDTITVPTKEVIKTKRKGIPIQDLIVFLTSDYGE